MGFEFDDFLYLNDGEQGGRPGIRFPEDRRGGRPRGHGPRGGPDQALGMEASKVSGFAQDMRAGRWSRSNALKRKAEPDWPWLASCAGSRKIEGSAGFSSDLPFGFP